MPSRQVQIKSADSKGRITLGESIANRTVIVERRGDEIVLVLARVIPEREAWLYEDPVALERVRKGLAEARKRDFVEGPDLAAAARIAEAIEGD